MEHSPSMLGTSGNWAWGSGVIVGALVFGVGIHLILAQIAKRVFRQSAEHLPLRGTFLRRLHGPSLILWPPLCAYAALPAVRSQLPPEGVVVLDAVLYGALVVAAT